MTLSILLFFKIFFFSPQPENDVPQSIYDFNIEALTGGSIDFSKYKGKKILVVNTASECGYTPQYEGLEALYKKNKDKLVIIGVPSNNFGAQEPGSNSEIASFCQKNYGVTFPMSAKVDVKGKDMAPLYQWLTQKEHNHFMNSEVKWNFQKYLLDENGKLIGVFYSKTRPDSPELLDAIKK